MSVDRLPNELLLKIFSDVSPIDLADCARVCIRWRDLIRWQIFDRKPVTKGRAKKYAEQMKFLAKRLEETAERGQWNLVEGILGVDEFGQTTAFKAQRSKTLCLAAAAGRPRVMLELLGAGRVDVNCDDGKGTTALHYAAQNGHEEVWRLLLSRKNIEVNCVDNHRATPLVYAAKLGRYSLVASLLAKKNVDVNCRSSTRGCPLHLAIENGHLQTVRELLKSPDLDVNRNNDSMWPAVAIAAFRGHVDIAKVLMADERTDLSLMDKPRNGTTLKLEMEECKRLLGEIRTEDKIDADYALHRVAEFGLDQVARCLLLGSAWPANINCRDCEGCTPLHIAAKFNNADIVDVLLFSPDVDVKAEDKMGKTALDYAQAMGNKAVILRLHAEELKARKATIKAQIMGDKYVQDSA